MSFCVMRYLTKPFYGMSGMTHHCETAMMNIHNSMVDLSSLKDVNDPSGDDNGPIMVVMINDVL